MLHTSGRFHHVPLHGPIIPHDQTWLAPLGINLTNVFSHTTCYPGSFIDLSGITWTKAATIPTNTAQMASSTPTSVGPFTATTGIVETGSSNFVFTGDFFMTAVFTPVPTSQDESIAVCNYPAAQSWSLGKIGPSNLGFFAVNGLGPLITPRPLYLNQINVMSAGRIGSNTFVVIDRDTAVTQGPNNGTIGAGATTIGTFNPNFLSGNFYEMIAAKQTVTLAGIYNLHDYVLDRVGLSA